MLRGEFLGFGLAFVTAGPTMTISAPSAAVASRLMAGALLGMTMTDFTPSARAA